MERAWYVLELEEKLYRAESQSERTALCECGGVALRGHLVGHSHECEFYSKSVGPLWTLFETGKPSQCQHHNK